MKRQHLEHFKGREGSRWKGELRASGLHKGSRGQVRTRSTSSSCLMRVAAMTVETFSRQARTLAVLQEYLRERIFGKINPLPEKQDNEHV